MGEITPKNEGTVGSHGRSQVMSAADLAAHLRGSGGVFGCSLRVARNKSCLASLLVTFPIASMGLEYIPT